MKLPTLTLRRDPAAALSKTRTDLAAAESKLADLQQQRQAALVDTDGIEQVQLVDSEIAGINHGLRILTIALPPWPPNAAGWIASGVKSSATKQSHDLKRILANRSPRPSDLSRPSMSSAPRCLVFSN